MSVWPPQLILDIALESHDLGDLLHKYDLAENQLDHFYTIPQFKRELLNARAELTQTGSAFRAHARVLAEAHLVTMNEMLSDPFIPAAQKITIWQSLVKYASLEPAKEVPGVASGGITINIAGYAALPARPAPAIDITPPLVAVTA
jgi:hypothetical protein